MQIKASRQAFKVALIYVIVAGAWILFSDELLKRLVHDPDARTNISIFKGWAFVFVTGSLLFLVIRRLLNRWAKGMKQLNQAETATRAAVEKLRQNEEQLRLVAEASADGIWDWNLKTGLAELNPRYWDIIGYAPGEVVADRDFFQRLVHPEDWPGVLATMTDHLAGKTADYRMEYRMNTKEGIEKWIWGRGKVVARAADGSPLRMVGTISDITFQKLSELLLVKSEQRYRGLFENMNEGFALCRMIFDAGEPKDFVFLAVNEMFTTLTGLKDATGKRITEILPGVREQDPELFELFGRVVKTGKPEKHERFLASLQMWMSLAVYSTEPKCFMAVFDVITERKRMEASLRDSEEKFRQLAESIADVFWICSPDFQTIHYVSPGYEKIWDRPAEGLCARPHEWVQAIIPEDRERVFAVFTALAGNESEINIEYRIARPDGSLRWIHDRGFQVRDAAGKLIRLTGVARDITERKHAEAALRASESRLQFLLSATPAIIYSRRCVGDHATTFVSDNVQAVLGHKPEAFSNDQGFWPAHVHPDDLPAAATNFAQFSGGDAITREYRFRHGDGSYRWMRDETRVVRDAQGQPQEFVGHWFDITARKQAEMELAESNSLLNATLEATADGILVVDGHGKVVNFNQKFLQLWQIPASLMASKDDHQLLHYVLAQLAEPARFLAKVEELYHTPQATSWDELKFKDGRVFERYSQPQRLGDNSVGRVWSFRDVTKRRRAEAALRQSQERYVLIEHATHDGLWDWNILTGEDYFSPRWKEIIGYQDAEVANQRSAFINLLHPDDKAVVLEATRRHLEQGEPYAVEFRLRHKDGSYRSVFSRGKALRDAAGHPIRMVGAVMDITGRKQTEVELARSHAQYRRAITAANAIPYQKDYAADSYVFMGEGIQDLTGYGPSELRSAVWKEIILETVFVGEAAGLTSAEAIRRILAGELKTWQTDHRIRTRSGAIRWISDSAIPILNAQGKYTGSVGIIQDITERRRAETALRESESLLRSIMENSQEVIFVKDLECRFVFMNPAGCRLTGMTAEKLLGRSKADFHPNPAEVAQFMADDRRVLESGQMETIEEEIGAADGTRLTFLTTKVARRDSQGQVIGLIGVAHDITQRKRSELEIQRQAAFARFNPNPVLELSAAGEIKYFNAATLQMAGALGQKNPAEMLPPNTAAIVRECLATARPLLRLETHAGNRTISWSFFPVESNQSVHCYAGDITERKHAEVKLRESEEKFSRMFQSSPVVMTLTSLEDGRYLDVNEAFLHLLEKPREEVVGQRSLDLGIWADAEQRAAVVAQLKAHGSVRNVILKIRKGSDQIRQVLWSGERVVIGETTCMLSSGLDITEQKLAEDALRESEERYRQLFELESDAIILVDCETHRYVDVNLSALQLYGYSREEFLQMKPEDVSDEPERTRATIGTGSFHVPLRWHRKKNGERFAAEISANQINYRGRQTELATVRDITARQQVMDMLGETTEQLLEAQHIAGLGSYVFDVTTGIWTSSEVLDGLFGIVDNGFTRDVAGWLQIIHPQERAEMQRYFQDEVLKNRAPFDRTYRIIRLRDQEERCVHGLGKLVLDDCGQVVRMVGVIQDITERKRAERALLESQALYSSLVMQLPIGIFRKDEQGRFVLVNPGFCQLKGLAEEDFLGKTPLEVIGGESAKRDTTGRVTNYAAQGEDHHRQIMRTGLPIELDEEYALPNGEKQFVHVMKFPVLNVDGKIIGSQGVLFDFTERKRAEERAHLQFSALTAAANAIVITDRQGTIVWVNPAFTKLTGYTEVEAVGANPRVLKSGEHAPAFYATMWATVSTGNIWHGELINRRKDGRLYTEDMTITPVRGASGQITHFVAIKQDVSERRQLENRLQQAQKMEAVGTLAGGIAHDFNNILAAIFGYGNLLQQDTEGNSAAQEDIGEILKAAGRAKDLVQQILTFSRQRDQKREAIRLDLVVKEATKFLRASLPAQIKIEMHLAEDAPAVLADPTQIYQVTMNLATNALHAMDGQPGRLTVALDSFLPDEKFIQSHSEFRPVQYTRLTIADTGHGMDAKTLARIFEPFFTTKPVGKGTGLGLAVVHGIVQSHDGAITVESQPGQGTTFCLYFPAQTPTEALTEAATAKLPGGRGQKILLVDDEPALTATFQRLLTRLNYQVITRNSAREAIALFREDPAQFDLVITDLSMPEMNGLELARQLRALRPNMLVILASGFTAELTRENLRAAGVCELLEKPIAMPALAEALQRTFAKP